MYAKWIAADGRFAFSLDDNGGVAITDADHRALLDGQAAGKRIQPDANGYPVLADPPAPTLAEAQAAKLREINRAYSAELATILDQYPDAETLTFDKQEREARDWAADNTTATPYLDAMLAERPLTKQELVDRIIAKADQFTAASGAATGKRQRLEDAITAAEDVATLEGITW